MSYTKTSGSIKILHLFAGQAYGGANKGAQVLAEAQRKLGLDVKVHNLRLQPTSIFKPQGLQYYWQKLLHTFTTRFVINKQLKPSAYFNVLLDNYIDDDFEQYDVLHLHWVSGFVGPKFFKRFADKIVITMRDEWFMTAGCHYSIACQQYESACKSCPLVLSEVQKNRIATYAERKRQLFQGKTIPVVTIGQSLHKKAKSSYILKNQNVLHINNLIAVAEPTAISNLDTQKTYFVMVAASLTSEYKGLSYLLNTKIDVPVKLIGKISEQQLKALPTNFEYLGEIKDTGTLYTHVKHAKALVVPSVAEAFGKIIVEAYSVGTPVIAFPIDEPMHLVKNGVTGILAKDISAMALGLAMSELLKLNSERYHVMRKACLDEFENIQDETQVVQEYLKVYESLGFTK